MTYMATPLHKNPSPGLMKFTILETKYCIFTIWPCHSTRTPAPGVMKFTTLVDFSFVVITLYLVCLINVWA